MARGLQNWTLEDDLLGHRGLRCLSCPDGRLRCQISVGGWDRKGSILHLSVPSGPWRWYEAPPLSIQDAADSNKLPAMFKPNVSPLLLDQMTTTVPTVITTKTGERVIQDPESTTERVVLWFYLLINIGGFMGVATAYAEKYIGFWLVSQKQRHKIYSIAWHCLVVAITRLLANFLSVINR